MANSQVRIIFPHLNRFLVNSLAVWEFIFFKSPLLSAFRHFVFSAERRGLSFSLGLFFLRRYSIDGPSFRWSNDGELMDYRLSIIGLSKGN